MVGVEWASAMASLAAPPCRRGGYGRMRASGSPAAQPEAEAGGLGGLGGYVSRVSGAACMRASGHLLLVVAHWRRQAQSEAEAVAAGLVGGL